MEKQIENILIKVDEGTVPVQQAIKELLDLFSAMPRSYGIVRWHDNEHEDVVCVDKATAVEYVKKYNELTGLYQCYVDEDIYLPLSNTIEVQEGETEGFAKELVEMAGTFLNGNPKVIRCRECDYLMVKEDKAKWSDEDVEDYARIDFIPPKNKRSEEMTAPVGANPKGWRKFLNAYRKGFLRGIVNSSKSGWSDKDLENAFHGGYCNGMMTEIGQERTFPQWLSNYKKNKKNNQ